MNLQVHRPSTVSMLQSCTEVFPCLAPGGGLGVGGLLLAFVMGLGFRVRVAQGVEAHAVRTGDRPQRATDCRVEDT